MPIHVFLHFNGVFYMRFPPHSLKFPKVIGRFKIPKLEQVIAEEDFPVNARAWRFAENSVCPPFHADRFREFFIGRACRLIGQSSSGNRIADYKGLTKAVFRNRTGDLMITRGSLTFNKIT